jgi:hypothetical protein
MVNGFLKKQNARFGDDQNDINDNPFILRLWKEKSISEMYHLVLITKDCEENSDIIPKSAIPTVILETNESTDGCWTIFFSWFLLFKRKEVVLLMNWTKILSNYNIDKKIINETFIRLIQGIK